MCKIIMIRLFYCIFIIILLATFICFFSGCATNTFRIVKYSENGVQMEGKCNSDCSVCTDILGHELPQTSSCYRACKNLPPVVPPDDPNVVDGRIVVVQADGVGNVYGFDLWRDNIFYSHESFISIKKGGNTNFKVGISQEYINAFSNGFVAVIEDDIVRSLSFSSDPNNVRSEYKFSGSTFGTVIPIYSTGFFISGGTIAICGINDDNIRTKLVSCLGINCEEWVKVVIYDEKAFSDYKLYRVNSVFNPTETEWNNNFNAIIKQAILKMNSIDINLSTDMGWDDNNNSRLDDWPATGLSQVPFERLELLSIVESVGEMGGCEDNINGATIVPPNPIRMNWLLTSDVTANSTIVSIHTTEGLEIGDQITIGPWSGSSANAEKVYIIDIPTSNSISVCQTWSDPCASGLRYNHARNDVCYIDDFESGVTFQSCSCVEDRPQYQTLVHEFLHQETNGRLLHVEDKDNIMYPINNRTDTKLRKRPLRHYDDFGTDEQWKKLHQ